MPPQRCAPRACCCGAMHLTNTSQGWGLAKCAGTGVFATEELLESIVQEVKQRRRLQQPAAPS